MGEGQVKAVLIHFFALCHNSFHFLFESLAETDQSDQYETVTAVQVSDASVGNHRAKIISDRQVTIVHLAMAVRTSPLNNLPGCQGNSFASECL